MLLLQAILGFLRRSAGKVIQSIFGWAVSALFGEVRKSERTLLSAVVGAVAFWPVLLAGIAFPKVAAFVLALIPFPKWTAPGALRIVWTALALVVPLGVGLVLQRREGIRKWGARNFVAGFPLTAGLSAAFALAFFALPIQKLRAAMRGEAEEHVTLIAEESAQDDVVGEIRRALEADGLWVSPERPPWLARMISGILRRTAAVVGKRTSPPRFFRGPDLELTLYPHGATVRGLPRATARAHAIIAGTATRTAALQTTDAAAQKLERKIKAAWKKASARRPRVGADDAFGEVARSVAELNCPYEDWEIVYRECLQLGFELRGIPDPIAGRVDARFHPDPAMRRQARRFARRARGLTQEKAASTAAKSVSKLAQKMAERFFGGMRAR
jgi:hypothetical protein